jgi:hypothetical protein
MSTSKIPNEPVGLVFDRFYVVIHLQKQQNLSPFSIKKYFLHLSFMQNSDFLNQWNFFFFVSNSVVATWVDYHNCSWFSHKKYPNGSILSGKLNNCLN